LIDYLPNVSLKEELYLFSPFLKTGNLSLPCKHYLEAPDIQVISDLERTDLGPREAKIAPLGFTAGQISGVAQKI